MKNIFLLLLALFSFQAFAVGSLSTYEVDYLLGRGQASAPSNPVAGKFKFYTKTDGKLYILNSSGTESSVGITAITGDATGSGNGSVALTFATVNSNVGSFGATSKTLTATANGKGLITAIAETPIAITESQVTSLVSDLSGKQAGPLTGDVTTSAAVATLASVNSNVGSFGSATQAPSFTVNAKGLITAASNNTIAITESQVTNLTSDLAGKQATGNYLTALTGDGTASGPGSAALTLATVNSNVGTFGSASKAIIKTVNGKGLTTAISETNIAITESQVTSLVSDLAAKQAGPLTGDATTSGAALTLASVNSNVGSFSNANITVNAKGLVTAASSGSAGSGSFDEIFQDDFYSIQTAQSGFRYYRCRRTLTFGTFYLTLGEKNGIASGSLTVDVKKSSSYNGSYTSIFSVLPTRDFASASDGSESSGTQTTTTCAAGDFLRLDVTAIPAGTFGFHVSFDGQI